MAKKTKAKDDLTKEIVTQNGVLAGEAPWFASARRAAEMKMNKADRIIGSAQDVMALPLPALSARYIFQNEGLPLGRFYHLVGPSGSFKSTFSVEMCLWHILCAGYGVIEETETKPTPDLRMSVLNWDDRRLTVDDCESVEDWQTKVTAMTDAWQKYANQNGGAAVTPPFCLVVDSLLGKAAEETINKVNKIGHASKGYAVEAGLITTFLHVYPGKMIGWPLTLVGINHLKTFRNSQGILERHCPGGYDIKYHAAVELQVNLVAKKVVADKSIAKLRLRTYKNSYGKDGSALDLNLSLYQQEDAPGVWRLHSRFEWWEASIKLLMGDGFSAELEKRLRPKINAVVQVHEKSVGAGGKRFWSNELGVPSGDAMPGHDLGLLLEKNSAVLNALYPILGIERRSLFEPAVAAISQLPGYEHVAVQAQDSAAARAAAFSLAPTFAGPLMPTAPAAPEDDFELDLDDDIAEDFAAE